MTNPNLTQSYEALHGVSTSATMQVVREAAAWARREGYDQHVALGFGRWYVRNTNGSTPLAAALRNFGGQA